MVLADCAEVVVVLWHQNGYPPNWDLLGLLPIYPLAKASYSLLDQSHGCSKLVNGNYLRIHIPLI